MLVCMLFYFSIGANSQRWKEYADSAKFFVSQSNTSKGIELYTKAVIELKRDSMWTAGYASICNSLANLHRRQKQYKEAESFYQAAKLIREKVLGKNSTDYAAICHVFADFYLETEQYKKAEPLYIEVRQLWKEIDTNQGYPYFMSCKSLGDLYWQTGEYQKAEQLYLDAKTIVEKNAKDDPEYTAVCNNLALLYKNMGQYEKALPLYGEVTRLIEEKYGQEHSLYATSCNNLADLYMDLGQYEKAEPLYERAKKIRDTELGKDHPLYAQSCNNLADLYMYMGQYEKAELLFIEARQIFEKTAGSKSSDLAQNSNNLGILYNKMNQLEKSEPFLLEAKQINEYVLGKNSPHYAANCSNLASLYSERGEYQKAESLLLEIKQISEKSLGKNHVSYALNCDNLGCLYVKMGNYQKAELLLREANKVFELAVGYGHRYFSTSCKNLVILYWIMHKTALAEAQLQKALGSEAKQLEKIFQFTSEKEKQLFIENVFDSYDTDQSFYFDQVPFDKAGPSYNLALRNRHLILTSAVRQRQLIYASKDDALQKLYEEWISLRGQLASAYLNPVAEFRAGIAKKEEAAGNLEKRLSRSSAAFSNGSMITNISWKNIQQKLMQNELAIEFVEFRFSNGRRLTDSTYYIALVLRKDRPGPELVKLFEKRSLDSLVSHSKYLAGEKEINALYTENPGLYNLIWKPLEKYLNGIAKIYFAAAGDLFKISAAALPVNNKQVLGDRYQLVQLNSTASIMEGDHHFVKSTDKVQLFGGIKYDVDTDILKQVVSSYQASEVPRGSFPGDLTRGSAFQYLPGTLREAEGIKKQADSANVLANILSGVDATEESVKALSGHNAPSVLHIATHGFFFPDPENNDQHGMRLKFETSGKVFKQSGNPLFRSGLLFAGANNAWRGKSPEDMEDGILTAYEVSNMFLPNTRLAVLSACETALGDVRGSEGVYGLQRAFKMAGVQNLVMSLWKVPDSEAAEFMHLFYRNVFAGQKISDAFYNAQNSMKNKYRDEPYKWAAWILVR